MIVIMIVKKWRPPLFNDLEPLACTRSFEFLWWLETCAHMRWRLLIIRLVEISKWMLGFGFMLPSRLPLADENDLIGSFVHPFYGQDQVSLFWLISLSGSYVCVCVCSGSSSCATLFVFSLSCYFCANPHPANLPEISRAERRRLCVCVW